MIIASYQATCLHHTTSYPSLSLASFCSMKTSHWPSPPILSALDPVVLLWRHPHPGAPRHGAEAEGEYSDYDDHSLSMKVAGQIFLIFQWYFLPKTLISIATFIKIFQPGLNVKWHGGSATNSRDSRSADTFVQGAMREAAHWRITVTNPPLYGSLLPTLWIVIASLTS